MNLLAMPRRTFPFSSPAPPLLHLVSKKTAKGRCEERQPWALQSLWAQSHFWHGLSSKEREPTLERVDQAPGARPATKGGFRGCNMELGYEEAKITTACPPLPCCAVGFPPGTV